VISHDEIGTLTSLGEVLLRGSLCKNSTVRGQLGLNNLIKTLFFIGCFQGRIVSFVVVGCRNVRANMNERLLRSIDEMAKNISLVSN
jgi:hypothetical protein